MSQYFKQVSSASLNFDRAPKSKKFDLNLKIYFQMNISYIEVKSFRITTSSECTNTHTKNLIDEDPATFWESHASNQAHFLLLTFRDIIPISRIDLLVNISKDNSYVPKKVKLIIEDNDKPKVVNSAG